MLTSTGSGAISSIRPAKVYYNKGSDREAPVQAHSSRKYDSVTLSCPTSGEKKFHAELLSRLSQEARTATTTGDIQALRRQVAAGEYHPDPAAIAARMLFLREEG